MCSFEIPNSLYGIYMDTTLTETRKYFIEYIETLPHIKKYDKDNHGVWYIFKISGFTATLFRKFLEKSIGTKVRRNPWRSCLVPTYHNGPIKRVKDASPKYGEHTYTSYYPEYDKVTLMTGELFYLVD